MTYASSMAEIDSGIFFGWQRLILIDTIPAPRLSFRHRNGEADMFTEANTEGFTSAELAIMNDALAALTSDGMDEKSASDAINNAWQSDLTAGEIVHRIANFGMVSA